MQSEKWTMNKSDWEARGRAALIWLSAPLLIYINQVTGSIQQSSHVFAWSDLIPSTFTWGGIVTYVLMQVQGFLIQLGKGK